MAFTVPDTSPPSTPDKSRSLFSNPSTTPAGPPPSSSASFGLPNSSTFGPSPSGSRSNFSFGESKFGQSDNFGGNDSLFSSLSSSKLPPMQNSLFSGSFSNQLGGFKAVNAGGNNLKVRNRKPHNLSQMSAATEDWEDEDGDGEEEEEEYEDEEEEEEEEEGEEEYEDEEEEEEEYEDMETEHTSNTFSGSQFGLSNMSFGQSGGRNAAVPQKRIYSNPGNAKRAKIDEQWATSSPVTAKTKPIPPKKPSQFPAIARDMASRTRAAAVTESGDVVLPTDEYVGELLDKLQGPGVGDAEAAALFSQTVTALTDLWIMASINEREQAGEYRPHNRFGPGENASGIEQATTVASLLLQLHHPPSTYTSRPALSNSRSLIPSGPGAKIYVPTPKILITWLNENHLGSAQEVDALKQMSPNVTASPDFWGIIQAGVLRGRFGDMASLLRSADFNYARSALQDGIPQAGYRGAQLQSIQKVVNKAIQMLEQSPLNQEDDWDVAGFEWAAYRKRVRSAQLELQDFAEGEEEPQVPSGPRFEASNFGFSGNFNAGQNGISFTQSLRMAESRVPWSIYQGIKTIYGTILGETEAVTSVAQDWFEATIGLTAWWDGDTDSQSRRASLVGENLQEMYLHRLSSSFGTVADSENARYRPDPFNRLHIGVVCVFEGDVKGALRLLETWSLCVATTVAEIAHEGGWFESGPESLPGFSENDLMVLSYGQDGAAVDDLTKDDILDSYAYGLGNRDKFQYNGLTRKGWQMALEMLSRIEDPRRTKERVSELLDVIPVDTLEQVEQVIIMCGDLGFEDEGRKIAANYGEQIMAEAGAKKDCDYGLAMICFARARSIRKLKEIANSLIAYSLQQSRAWPPDEQLGGQLRSLVKNPKVCLSSIAKVDEDAAGILQFYASGYATLRRFYDLRDEQQAQSKMRPMARKRAAAEALVAVIRSSADSIYGGLYDPERDSAVLVDNLLSLLGEVLVFVGDSSSSILSVEQQSIILAAIEDLETVAPRVFAAVQEFFYECLNEYIFEKTKEPRKGPSSSSSSGLQKSTSGLTTSSTFSMVGSEMMVDSVPNGSSTNDKNMVPRPDTMREYAKPIQRGWDWRAGLAESASGGDEDDVKPENKILRILRLKLAKGMVWR